MIFSVQKEAAVGAKFLIGPIFGQILENFHDGPDALFLRYLMKSGYICEAKAWFSMRSDGGQKLDFMQQV